MLTSYSTFLNWEFRVSVHDMKHFPLSRSIGILMVCAFYLENDFAFAIKNTLPNTNARESILTLFWWC